MRARIAAFPGCEFDIVLSLDVLAFRGVDEQSAIGEMYRVLRPGGSLIINVPAFDFLRGSHDAAVSQIRRYTRPQLAALLKARRFPARTLELLEHEPFASDRGRALGKPARAEHTRRALRSRSDVAAIEFTFA